MPRKLTYEEVVSEFNNAGYTIISGEYGGQYSKMKCICSCGAITDKSLRQLRQSNKCFKCGSAHRKHTIDYVSKVFEDAGCKLISDKYEKVSSKLDYICSCGNKSEITFNHFSRGVRCRICGIKKNSGKYHANYKESLTDEERERFRLDWKVKVWAKDVKERDNYMCMSCGKKAPGSLVSHHLDSYDIHKDQRYVLENGVTLCNPCHIDFHVRFGFGDNTREQFEDFMKGAVSHKNTSV